MRTIDVDVAIVGAGCAGLACALTVAEQGLRTAVFEKAAVYGGVSNGGMGFFAVESKHQKKDLNPLTCEQAYDIFIRRSLNQVDAGIVSDFVNRSKDMIEWMEDLGGNFGRVVPYIPGGHATWHTRREGSAFFADLIWREAEKAGATMYLQTPVRELKTNGGKVTGLVVESADGERIEVNARSILLATGGFGTNPDMVAEYTKFRIGVNLDPPFTRVPVDGDGLKMAWAIGAEKGPMMYDANSSTAPDFGGPGGMLLQSFRQPNLIVDLNGERFMDEAVIKHGALSINAICQRKNQRAYIIFDQAIETVYETEGWDYVLPPFGPSPSHSDGKTIETVLKAMKKGYQVLFAADSLEEIARLTGINVANLQATVDKYNQACRTGRDPEFHKDPRYLRPISQPKYLCGRIIASGYGTLGGIRTNRKFQVLDTYRDPIAGLYCAGTDCNHIAGDAYTFEMPGLTSGFAYYSGRRAGESILEQSNIQIRAIRRNLTPADVPQPSPGHRPSFGPNLDD